jgi:DtxR family Mn-dependent transcriptional regulator
MGNLAEERMLEVGSDRSAGRAREDYVKAIYQLGEEGIVRAADVARHLGVTPVAVSKARRILERELLVEKGGAGPDGLHLTKQGRDLALAMVRRHRLLETFLYTALNIPLHRIHAEAERIEHVFSDDLAERLAKLMGRPEFDPHGHPVPYGSQPRPARPARLTRFGPGTAIRVVSLDDRDEEAVKALAAAGVLPGLRAVVHATGAASVHLKWKDKIARLSRVHAEMVRVSV